MKVSEYRSYDDLPLFLNAAMVVPKEKFVEWVKQHTNGGGGG